MCRDGMFAALVRRYDDDNTNALPGGGKVRILPLSAGHQSDYVTIQMIQKLIKSCIDSDSMEATLLGGS